MLAAWTAFALGTVGQQAFAIDAPCGQGWLEVQAQITRIDPPAKKARKIKQSGVGEDIGVDGPLCAGDTLAVPDDVRWVEYYEAGHVTQIGTKQTHTVMATSSALVTKAAEYVRLAMQAVNLLAAPPSRPGPTASRGSGPVTAADAGSLHAILPLRDLPRQRLVPDAAVTVGWRDGQGPYSCEILDDTATSVWKSAPIDTGWCEYRSDLRLAARLVVRDTRLRTVGWNVAPAVWHDVPRPDWVAAEGNGSIEGATLAAWGVWLWQNGGPPWRLQSLAMLSRASRTEWLAGYFIDNVLAEAPPVRAQ